MNKKQTWQVHSNKDIEEIAEFYEALLDAMLVRHDPRTKAMECDWIVSFGEPDEMKRVIALHTTITPPWDKI